MSLFRTPNPSSKSNKIKIAAAGVALAAAAAGGVGAWSASAASHPAAGTAGVRSARAASHSATGTAGVSPAGAASSAGANLALALWTTAPASQPVALDAFTAKALPATGTTKRHKGKAVRLTPKQIARRMLHSFHWSKWQFQWLDLLWSRESSWNVYATNPYSGAYGIPQAVPGDKMSSAGPDWESDARTQIRWGLDYIKDRYGSPHGAWEHELATGWY